MDKLSQERNGVGRLLGIEENVRATVEGICLVIRKAITSITKREVVLCLARPQAGSRAKPSQNRPGQAGPKVTACDGFWLGLNSRKPKPSRQAAAFD